MSAVPLLPMQRNALLDIDWTKVLSVRRAGGGCNEGAWFFISSDYVIAVVKEAGPKLEQFVAAVFLEHLQFKPPAMRAVPCNSCEGQQIYAAANLHSPKHPRPLGFSKPSHYLVMEFIGGAALDDIVPLKPPYYLQILCEPENLVQLGKLVIFDVLMGNGDRFNLQNNNANFGNLMLDGALRPIDSVFVTPDNEMLGFTKLMLQKILARNDTSYADKVKALLVQRFKKDLPDVDASCIHRGMRQAAQDFASPAWPALWQSFVARVRAAGLDPDCLPKLNALHQIALGWANGER